MGLKPDRPGAGGGGTQWKPGGGNDRFPNRPGAGGSGTQFRPGDNNRLPNRPGGDNDRFPNRPGGGGNNLLPSRPGQGGGGTQWKPGGGNDRFPNRPGQGGGGTQWRPGGDNNRFPNRPGQGGGGTQWRPGGDNNRFPNNNNRPDRGDKWNNIQNKSNNQWNQWKQNNNVTVNNFQANRTNNWNNINQRYNERGWAGRYGSDDYWKWRGNVTDFRRDRCNEIWDRREDFWDDCFDNRWWGSAWWRPAPIATAAVVTSPWWWWQPVTYSSATTFFAGSMPAQPATYDPGTTVIYEGDTYYVNGKASGTAEDARKAAIQLASPAVDQIPVPDPPAEGQPAEWMPLGVWALTQQEQGDATMFMQFSVDKNGLVGGAYQNVLTGDSQPIVGQLDKQTQRIAWHVGEATQTVYETGFSNLENDVASVFVHFGENSTQTWLLVRLPSPEVPPGPVKLPEPKKP